MSRFDVRSIPSQSSKGLEIWSASFADCKARSKAARAGRSSSSSALAPRAPKTSRINQVEHWDQQIVRPLASSNKCIATSNKCLTSSNKKLLETSATLVVTSASLLSSCHSSESFTPRLTTVSASEEESTRNLAHS